MAEFFFSAISFYKGVLIGRRCLEEMRMWHKDLISVLPRKQLMGQWQECCAIAKSIAEKGEPNHVLVNRITDYPVCHLYTYGFNVFNEMVKRKYKCDFNKFSHYFTYPHETFLVSESDLFSYWHNKRYLKQCYYNLEEKYDCGDIGKKEFETISLKVKLYEWSNIEL